jgi:hypothetical protein
MSMLRPSDPTGPESSAGCSEIHTSALVSVLTMALLWVLQDTVFKHSELPANAGYIVSGAVSYAIGQASGRIARARRLRAAHRAASSLVKPPA